MDFDVTRFSEYLAQVNPQAQILQTSTTRGDGLPAWQDWLTEQAGSLATASTPPT